MVYEVKHVDKNTIQIDAKDITDGSIYELCEIKKTLDTYNIKKMTYFKYDYEPYYSWGRREPHTSWNTTRENYTELLDKLFDTSRDDRRRGWSNKINYLTIKCELNKESSLDFIKGQIYALMINASEDTAYEQGFVDGLRKVYEMIENEL